MYPRYAPTGGLAARPAAQPAAESLMSGVSVQRLRTMSAARPDGSSSGRCRLLHGAHRAITQGAILLNARQPADNERVQRRSAGTADRGRTRALAVLVALPATCAGAP